MFLDYFALTLLIVISIILIYAAIYIHDIPYEMAVKRNHPHQDAIHYGGWLSLFTLHAIWPFLWIWATLYRPETGYGFEAAKDGSNEEFKNTLAELEQTVSELQAQIHSMRSLASESEQSSATEIANDGEQS
jgi:type VI protein secretion system component VasK